MPHTTQIIKVIALILLSYLLFLLFVFNFRVVTIEALFNINSFFWYMFLISLISAVFFTNSLIYFSEHSEKYVWFSVFLCAVCMLTGSMFLLKEFDRSLILSVIICFAFIPSVVIPINMRKNLIKLNSFSTFGRIQRYTTLFLALSFAFSFYFYENLNTNNPQLATFMNSFIDQTTANALKTMGVNSGLQTPKVEDSSRINFIKDKINSEIAGLKGDQLSYYNDNKDLVDGLLGGFLNSEIKKQSETQSPFTKGIKDTVNNFINTYKQIILIVGSVLVYFFITSVFYFSGIFIIPIYTALYKMLIKIGFFEKVKKNIEVERLEI